jgi:hypothetical protein
MRYGVAPIFFDPLDSKFTGYPDVIGTIVSDVAPAATGGIVGRQDSTAIAQDVAQLEALTALNMKKGATGELR